MANEESFIDKIGKGKLAVAAGLVLMFFLAPDVFHYLFVMVLLIFPLYIVINKWLDD